MAQEDALSRITEKNLPENMIEQPGADLKHLFEVPGQTILFVGVGNVLKHDDGVGVFIASRIKQSNRIKSLVVEVSIENYIGKINRTSPDILIIIDATDFGKKPGFSRLAEVSELKEITTNTHNISIAQLSELFNMPVYILGIQPADVSFGEGLCREVIQAAERVIQMINSGSMVMMKFQVISNLETL